MVAAEGFPPYPTARNPSSCLSPLAVVAVVVETIKTTLVVPVVLVEEALV